MDDQLLNFLMLFRSIPFTAETSQEEKIRLILQHQNPSLPPRAKSPEAKVTGTFKAPNLSSPPTPKTAMLNPSPNQQTPPNLSSSQIHKKTAILKPPKPKHTATPIMIPKTSLKKAAAAAVERRPAPSAGSTASMLQDYSDDEINAGLRHLGILFYGTTRRFEKQRNDS